MKRTELVIMEVMLALFVFGIDKEGEVMIKGKNTQMSSAQLYHGDILPYTIYIKRKKYLNISDKNWTFTAPSKCP